MLREYTDQVTKPSLIFTSQASATKSNGAGGGSAQGSPITNFGLEPGFHVSAHLESAVSTFGNIPAVAIIEYNYIRNGQILIPAGSRVVGRLSGGSATGIVSLQFNEVYLPDGSRVPISAIGLDPTLKPIKGKVTGRNTGKEFLLASITSVGSLGAGFLGTGNSSAVTQESLARDQISSNIGRAGDQAIQNMVVNSQLVVTVASGTLIEVTFTSPARRGAGGIEPTAGGSNNR
jgi:type IV secretory pathway VirB10-like protein